VAAGDLPDWLRAVYDRFEVMGKVVWCRYDRDDPPSVECAIEMWVRPDRRDEFEQVLRQPPLPSKVSTSSFAEDGLLAVLSTPRPETCPKLVVPWAPCDVSQCALTSRPNKPRDALPLIVTASAPSLRSMTGLAGDREPLNPLAQPDVETESCDKQFRGHKPSALVVYRILRTLCLSGGSSLPTPLQPGSRTNYTQLRRYLEYMEPLGLVELDEKALSGRRPVHLTPTGEKILERAGALPVVASPSTDPACAAGDQAWREREVALRVGRALEEYLARRNGHPRLAV
jgi:predicted transcriptional regulator